MKLVNGVGIVVAALAATAMASARAEASSFTYSVNFCPGGGGCATGVTEASLSFDEITAGSDSNDYLLTATFKGDASAVSSVDAWSFTIDGVKGLTGNGGYESLPILGATFPTNGSPWVVSYDNVNNGVCNNGGGGQEVCLESAGTPPSLTSTTLKWTVFVNLADDVSPLGATSQINLRARFQPSGNLSPGSQTVTVGTGGNDGVEQQIGPTAVPEPASLALLGSGLLAMASSVRKRLKNRS